MQKLLRFALLFIAVMMVGTHYVQAQLPTLPTDSAVRIGKLPNGLTYYIRHNEKPKGQADFYIAQKVGSILENDSQQGLAHFLEHMCFNGTTSFPGNSITSWLETKGVKFGVNLNAVTGFDETIYNISNVPVTNKAVQDSCLLILHDWANDLLLDPEEIDKERGVIHQEWRSRNVGDMRLYTELLPTIFPGSKYAHRMPIGLMEIVDNFPPQDLRDYYEAWYRPDQQGIVVVGDIDVDYIEGKIKEMFSGIEMPENAQPREYEPVDDNDGTIFAIGADPEISQPRVDMMFKADVFPDSLKSNSMYLLQRYALNIMCNMLNDRLREISNQPDAPFAMAVSYYDNFFVAKTKDALTLRSIANDKGLLPAIEAAYRELLRAQRGGFTESEYERARSSFLSAMEKAYNGRESRSNEEYVNEYVDNFTDGEPIPSIDDEYQFWQMVTPMITVDVINQLLPEIVTEDNRVFMVLAPKNDTFVVPTAEQIAEVIAAVDAEDIEPHQDAMKAEPLIPELPVPGKVLSITDDAQWGAKVLTLSNGVKVVVKPTSNKKDDIRLDAMAIGGMSVESDDQYPALIATSLIGMLHGYGDYSNSDLKKYLQGKQASLSFDIDDYNREITGYATPKDLKYLMELIYMTFGHISSDANEYAAAQNKLVSLYKGMESTPDFKYSKFLSSVLYESRLKQMPTADDFLTADREAGLAYLNKSFSNAADFTFFFVGDVDMDTFVPLVEQYIATLPADKANVTGTYTPNPRMEVKGGTGTDVTTAKMETPQTTCAVFIEGSIPYNAKNRQIAGMAPQILSSRLLKSIREEMGAVYSIGAVGSMARQGEYNVVIQIPFPMKPEAREEVLAEISKLANGMAEEVTEEELAPVREYMLKSMGEAKESNETIAGSMSATVLNGVDIFNGIEDVISSITTEDVEAYMKELLSQGNYRVVLMNPEE